MATWAVDGGKIPAALLRAQTFAQMGLTEGISRAGDYKVSQIPAPAGAVRISPGTGILLNKYLGSDGGGQSYATLQEIAQDIPVPATTTGAATRYVIQRVTDHNYPGEQLPADPVNHIYDTFRVVSAIPTSYPNIPLARISQPANTSQILDSMITDLREMANPKSKELNRTLHISSGEVQITALDAFPVGQHFPHLATTGAAWRTFPVPLWATRMKIRAEWFSISVPALASNGQVWVTYGLTDDDTNGRIQPSSFAAEDTNGRQMLVAQDTVRVLPEWRGRDLRLNMRARRSHTRTPIVKLDLISSIALTVTFTEVAE